MKGIILAGGLGTRLHPITKATSKQLLPLYDKPVIYYSLSVLLLAEINDVLLISTPYNIDQYKRLLGDGSQFGISLQYKVQNHPDGLASAFIIGEEFIGPDNVCLVLGDNVFWGQGFSEQLRSAKNKLDGATIFAYEVNDASDYGVVELGSSGQVISLEEKPKIPKSNYAITGLYFYDNSVVELAKFIKPSDRGELEITDINQLYLKNQKLKVERLGRGLAWLDTGSCESLLDASVFVRSVQKRQNLKIACLEEIAWRNGWLDDAALRHIAETSLSGEYQSYVLSLLQKASV